MAENEGGYKPSTDFELNDKNSLLDIPSLDSNKEIWLIQWPSNLMPDINDLEVTLKLNDDGTVASLKTPSGNLKLNDDGTVASLKTPSGKSLEMVSFACQEPDATVFQSSNSTTRIVGKISRRVSLVDYSEPSEPEKSKFGQPGQFYQRSVGTFSRDTSRRHGSVTTSSKHRSYSGLTPTRSSKQRSSLFTQDSTGRDQSGVTSLGSGGHSTGHDQSGVSSLGSAGRSEGRKSKKIKHTE